MVHPPQGYNDWILHQYREHNKLADSLATMAITSATPLLTLHTFSPSAHAIWGAFDGGKREQGSGMGFWLAAGFLYGPPQNPLGLRWSFLAMGCLPLQGTVPEAELSGATALALVTKYLVRKRQQSWKEAEATMEKIKLRMRVTPSEGSFPIRTRLQRTTFSQAIAHQNTS